MPNTLAFQSPKLVTGFLNQESLPGLGTPLNSSQVSGSIVQQYTGYLGADFVLDAKTAKMLSDTVNVGQLYEGLYGFVQLKSSFATTGVDLGCPLYWFDRTNYIVTPDVTGPTARLAGICIIKNAKMAPGNYLPIQFAGRATLKLGVIQNVAAADGDAIFLDVSQNLFNDLTATGSVTAGGVAANSAGIKLWVGTADNGGVAPASNSLCIVDLSRWFDNQW
jgi:hypothetical protein